MSILFTKVKKMWSNGLPLALTFSDKKLISVIKAKEVVLASSYRVSRLWEKVIDAVFIKLNPLKISNQKPYLYRTFF